jgi:hypothetical protein
MVPQLQVRVLPVIEQLPLSSVQVTPEMLGRVSLVTTLLAEPGPLLVVTIWKRIAVPVWISVTEFPEPSTAVLPTATSAHCTVTVAVELLLSAGDVSLLALIVAVLVIVPHCAAVAFVVLVTVMVIEPPELIEKPLPVG